MTPEGNLRVHMRLYWEVAKRGFRRYATYRGATVGGLFTNTVFGFLRGYVLLTLFRTRLAVGGYGASDALTYTWLIQATLMVIYIWGWNEVALRIRSGDIVTDLYRPLDYQGYLLAQDLGRSVYHALFRGIVPFLTGALFFTLRLPTNPLTWPAFACSLALAVVISFGYRFLANLAAFWLIDYRGVTTIATFVSSFLAGFIVPVVLFPHWLSVVAHVLPFASMIQVPIDVFLEKYSTAGVAGALVWQAVWAAALLAAGRLVLATATRRLVVQGG